MIRYRYIGHYNDASDIYALFPSADIKPDMADIVVGAMKAGNGNFHKVNLEENWNDVDDLTEYDIEHPDPGMVFTTDKKYCVWFTRGDAVSLRNGDDCHGYYMDIYEQYDVDLPEPPDYSMDDLIRIMFDSSTDKYQLLKRVEYEVLKEGRDVPINNEVFIYVAGLEAMYPIIELFEMGGRVAARTRVSIVDDIMNVFVDDPAKLLLVVKQVIAIRKVKEQETIKDYD